MTRSRGMERAANFSPSCRSNDWFSWSARVSPAGLLAVMMAKLAGWLCSAVVGLESVSATMNL